MPPVVTPYQAKQLLGKTGGGTSPERGAEIYEFVKQHGFEECLELGFAHGVGTVYIAAALQANGVGRLTSVDLPSAWQRTPRADEVVARAGLTQRVELVIEPWGYNWFLRRKLRERLTEARIEPVYDFVFIDGGHTWVHDGFAFALVDRLLKPGGWILFDDLDWKFTDDDVPDDLREIAQVREIWELLVMTHPGYDELRTDGSIGWAHKTATGSASVRTVYKQDVLKSAIVIARSIRSKLRGMARGVRLQGWRRRRR